MTLPDSMTTCNTGPDVANGTRAPAPLGATAALTRARRPPPVQAILSLALLLGGCQSPALVRTARTLPEGKSDLSMSVNLTRISLAEVSVEGVELPLRDFNLPNPLPDVLFNHGMTSDFELGGRLSLGSGLLELNAKYRYLEAANGTLHLAAAPALGYRVLGLVNGPVLTLPLIVTYDASPGLSLSGGPLISYAAYSVPDSLEASDVDIGGDTLYAGGGLGIQFRPGFGFHVMPALEVQRSISRRGDVANLPVIDMLFLGVTFGWGPNDRTQPVPPDPFAPQGVVPDSAESEVRARLIDVRVIR